MRSANIDGKRNIPPPGIGCIKPNSARRLGLNAIMRLGSGSGQALFDEDFEEPLRLFSPLSSSFDVGDDVIVA